MTTPKWKANFQQAGDICHSLVYVAPELLRAVAKTLTAIGAHTSWSLPDTELDREEVKQ